MTAALARPVAPPSIDVAAIDLPVGGIDLKGLLAEIEDHLIAQAMDRSGGNKQQAATLLGLNRTTLVEKLARREAETGPR